MTWYRKFARPIIVKDGRTIATLGEAREMVLSLPVIHRRGEMRRYTADILNAAAADISYVPHTDAEAQFLRSLRAEGLI